MNRAEVVVGGGIVRLSPNSVVIVPGGLVESAGTLGGGAEVDVGLDEAGFDFDGPPEMLDGLSRIAPSPPTTTSPSTSTSSVSSQRVHVPTRVSATTVS